MGRWRRERRTTSTRLTPATSSASTRSQIRNRRTAAIGAAAAAFGPWSSTTPQQRADALDRIGSEILARQTELGDLLAREEGKTTPEARGEVGRAGQIFKFFAGEALRAAGELIPSVRPGVTVDVTREPIGVVGAHHALEFSDRHPVLEDRPCPGLREHASSSSQRTRHRAAPGRCRRSSAAPACPPARSTSSWDAGRRSGRCSSTIAASPGSALPGRLPPATRLRRHVRRDWPSVSSRWAARTRSSSLMTPTSTWRPTSLSRARSSLPASGAPRRRA